MRDLAHTSHHGGEGAFQKAVGCDARQASSGAPPDAPTAARRHCSERPAALCDICHSSIEAGGLGTCPIVSLIWESIMSKLLFTLALIFPISVSGVMVATLASQPAMACNNLNLHC